MPFVGIAADSVKILLAEPQFQSMFSAEEQQSFTKAVDLVFEGLKWADTTHREPTDHPFTQLPKETQHLMLSLINRLLPPRSVDLDAQTFVLRDRPHGEPDLPCEYGSELEDAVKEFLDGRVAVSGTLDRSQKTKKPRMLADTIEPVPKDEDQNGMRAF